MLVSTDETGLTAWEKVILSFLSLILAISIILFYNSHLCIGISVSSKELFFLLLWSNQMLCALRKTFPKMTVFEHFFFQLKNTK